MNPVVATPVDVKLMNMTTWVLGLAFVALGAVAPIPLRARRTEALLEGRPLDAALIEQAATCAADEATPIDDVRASAWYRKELVHNMTKRMLDDVAHH